MTNAKINKLTWTILYSVMGVTLIGSLVYFNFIAKDKTAAEVTVNTINGKSTASFNYTSFHHEAMNFSSSAQDEKGRSSFLVFLEDADDELIKNLDETKKGNENCDIFVLFPYQAMSSLMQKVNVDYANYDLQFGYDDNESFEATLPLSEEVMKKIVLASDEQEFKLSVKPVSYSPG